jgi:6-pyruvoyltetrahydropterin/6-carboxytetrahydropterin synthase
MFDPALRQLRATGDIGNIIGLSWVTMTFEISTTRRFCAAHSLRLYDGSMEPTHGHNWQVRVSVSADRLDAIGVVMDFHELERLVDAIITPLHNRHLNEVADDAGGLQGLNPTAENVAVHIQRHLKLPNGVRLTTVEVWETSDNRAVLRCGQPA